MLSRRELLYLVAAPSAFAKADDLDFARRIFARINDIRTVNAVPELAWSDALAARALEQSQRKAALRFAGHNDPERGDVAARLNTAGIAWSRCAENLFMEKGWDDPVDYAAVFWWYSPGHQANLLNPDYTETGIGLAQGTDGAWFVTQIFLAPPLYLPSARR